MIKFLIIILLFISSAFLFCSCENNQKQQITKHKNALEVKKQNPQMDISTISFGFLNDGKDSLVKLPNENDSVDFRNSTLAIIDNKIVPIQFLIKKPESEASTGRQTSQNFAHNGGEFFKINSQNNHGDFALLVDETFFKSHEILKFKKDNKEIDNEIKNKLEKRYQRKIKKSQLMYTIEDQSLITMTSFELKNDSALAVLSYLKNGILTNLEFEAKYDPISTWRVDDNGEFNFEALEVLSLFKTKNGISMVTVFWGPEGYHLDVYESGDGIFKNKLNAYGYSAAQ